MEEDACGKSQAEGLLMAHWETFQYLRRKDNGVALNYLKDPCAKRALELGWGIIATASSVPMARHI